MERKNVRKGTNKKVNAKSNITKKKVVKKDSITKKTGKKNIKPIVVIDYIFLVSLVLSVIFGMQTNGAFMIPFTIVLVITIICMCIILINAIYSKIRKIFGKAEK